MLGQVLTLSALVALTQAKAIVTNHCKKDIYVWSVPVKDGIANNLSISPGKRYEEPWRYGTSVNPGVAIKISYDDDGINLDKSEIDFQYSVDPSDHSKIWIDLSTIRSQAFSHNVALHTCKGLYEASDVSTHQCTSTDDIELVLCGTERTVPPHDSTPPDAIADCIDILHKRNSTGQPRQCNGRVVGPKRMPQQEEQTDGSDDEKTLSIPLKTVMRHEAAKHAASKVAETQSSYPRMSSSHSAGTIAQPSAKPGTFCNLLQKSWPDAQCDEGIAEHNARLFYEDNCGQSTKDMFPGASCESIRKEMKRVFPDIDQKPIESTVDKHEKRDDTRHYTLCIHRAYDLLKPHWYNVDDIRKKMNALFQDRAWTDNEGICSGRNQTLSSNAYRIRRCVNPYCRPAYRGDCSDVEDALEELSKRAGHNIDWTTDDDACGWERAANGTKVAKRHDVRKVCVIQANEKLGKYWGPKNTERMVERIFPDIPWVSDDESCKTMSVHASQVYYHKLIDKSKKKTKVCVSPYCQDADCGKIKKQLNKLSKDVGKNYDWTTDDGACLDWIKQSANGTAVGPRYPEIDAEPENCFLAAQEKLTKYWGPEKTKEFIIDIFDYVDLTDDELVCAPSVVEATKQYNRNYLPKTKTKYCVSPYCKPYQLDCSDVEDALEEVSKDLGRNWDWTTDDDACGTWTKRRSQNTVAERHQRRDFHEVCIRDPHRRLAKYWSDNATQTTQLLQQIFPDVPFVSNQQACDHAAVKATRNYYHDFVPKKKTKRCVKPYCHDRIIFSDCSEVEDELEHISKDVGKNYDWTTSDSECDEALVQSVSNISQVIKRNGNATQAVERDQYAFICIKPYCEPHLPGVDCSILEHSLDRVYHPYGLDFTNSGETCSKVKTLLDKPAVYDRSGSLRVCLKPICDAFSHPNGARCIRTGAAFEKYFSEGFSKKIIMTLDNDVC